MTDQEHTEEGGEEAIEDLEAPAGAQRDVVGGSQCIPPTCSGDTSVAVECMGTTCKDTSWNCVGKTAVVVLHEH